MSYRYGYNRYNDPDYYWKADENKIKRDFMNYANKSKKIEEEGYKKMGKTWNPRREKTQIKIKSQSKGEAKT